MPDSLFPHVLSAQCLLIWAYNPTPCPPPRFQAATGAWPAQANDVVFLRAIAEWLRANASVDAGKVMVTGMSAGAMMANRMGCDATGTFAAVAAVEGESRAVEFTTLADVPEVCDRWFDFFFFIAR